MKYSITFDTLAELLNAENAIRGFKAEATAPVSPFGENKRGTHVPEDIEPEHDVTTYEVPA